MCDYCLMRDKETVARVQLRQPKPSKTLWSEKVYNVCQDCKDYLRGVFKHAK